CIANDWATNGDTFDRVAPFAPAPANRFNNPTPGPVESAAGFFVVGPDLGAKPYVQPTRDPGFAAPSHKSKALTARVTIADQAASASVSIVPQRPACPHLPKAPVNNPYVPFDYCETTPAPAMMTVNVGGPLAAIPAWQSSVGRKQPFAAALFKPQLP